jgi:glycosyltransferase involved in cell wall biosynthesis
MVPLAGRSAGVPVRVRTITGMGYIFSSQSPKAILLRPIYRYLQRRASSATTITIFQNPDDQVYFRKHKMVKSGCDELVLSAGIDLQGLWSQIHKPDFLQTLSDEIGLTNCFVICLVSRLVKHKGIMEYLKAAKLICNRYPHVKFLLVGPLSSEGKQAVSRSTIDSYCEYVTYLGPRRDVPDLLTLTDLFVLPSYYREGVPRVLLEAGAVGIPLITTDTPGCKEVVIDGLNGLTVPPGNHQALADAIEKILNMNLSERRLMGERSKNHVELNFELTKVASVHAAIYERCLKECII